MLEFKESCNGHFLEGREGDDLIVLLKPFSKRTAMLDKNATSSQLRQIADKLDELNHAN